MRKDETNPPSAVNSTGRDAEPYIGGADAIEKTSDLGDVHGAGPHPSARPADDVTATVRSGSGLGVLGWVVIALALIVAVAYLAGLFT